MPGEHWRTGTGDTGLGVQMGKGVARVSSQQWLQHYSGQQALPMLPCLLLSALEPVAGQEARDTGPPQWGRDMARAWGKSGLEKKWGYGGSTHDRDSTPHGGWLLLLDLRQKFLEPRWAGDKGWLVTNSLHFSLRASWATPSYTHPRQFLPSTPFTPQRTEHLLCAKQQSPSRVKQISWPPRSLVYNNFICI